MKYTKISPLGPREGFGTFDCIFDTEKYPTIREAGEAGDYVQIDFVQDEEGVIYFQFAYSRRPTEYRYERLQVQHFPFGIDMFDDQMAVQTAIKILKEEAR